MPGKVFLASQSKAASDKHQATPAARRAAGYERRRRLI